MGYFDSEKNVTEYLKLAKGYDGKELIKKLKHYLPKGQSVLELGMGPGKDLNMLKRTYTATGSDNSRVFLDRYKQRHPDAKLQQLDAVTLTAKGRFDCIYSNKVLHHLTKTDLRKSLRRQSDILKRNGLVMHSFWKGNKQERFSGLLFTYYTAGQIVQLFEDLFEPLEIVVYSEMKSEDSIYFIGRKKSRVVK